MKGLKEADTGIINEKFEELLRNCKRCEKDEDRKLVEKAFMISNEAHKGMLRKSGEPYILHPIAVARIISEEMRLGPKSIACALLHDVVEDTDYTIDDIKYQFGEKVASIIDGLTKISGVFDNKSSLQAENFRKMLLTLSDDVRVILIKLADRLHNMRTLHALPAHKQFKIAGETLYLYAPLAHRLGLNTIKTELEDLSLKYQHPKIYNEISRKLEETKSYREQIINTFNQPIIEALGKNNISFRINGRVKSIYSIWKKMQEKDISLSDIYDLIAVRIVFNSKENVPEKTQCWEIYSLITDIYTPKPERIRDWISKPKANGYEALHVTVMGAFGNWVEVQIRSERMDEIAELGFAAHWKYKGIYSSENELDKWIQTIKEHLENPTPDAMEFLDEFKLNLFSQEIMVFTPKGHIKTLPKDATALDFAYEIHTEIGNKAIGAKVNHKLIPLNHKLSSGDQVEIITSDKQRSQVKWLNYVNTAKAKASITSALKAERKNRILRGQRILENKLKELNLQPSSHIFKKLSEGYNVVSKDELYSKIGSDIIKLDDIQKIVKKKSRNKIIKYWQIQLSRSNQKTKTSKKNENGHASPLLISDDETETLNYNIAECCKPIPGDDVVGFRNKDGTVTIHQSKCHTALKLMSSRGDLIVPAKWTSHKVMSFLATLYFKGIDRKGLAYDITSIIYNENNVSMRSVNLDSSNGVFEGKIDLYIHNTEDLNNLIARLSQIKGIEHVIREEKIED